MYQTTTPSVSRSLNGMGNQMIDGSGTINPAALNSSGMTCLSLSLLLIESPSVVPAQCKYLTSTHPSNCMDTALSQWLTLTDRV
jgi:hypothetical protein